MRCRATILSRRFSAIELDRPRFGIPPQSNPFPKKRMFRCLGYGKSVTERNAHGNYHRTRQDQWQVGIQRPDPQEEKRLDLPQFGRDIRLKTGTAHTTINTHRIHLPPSD